MRKIKIIYFITAFCLILILSQLINLVNPTGIFNSPDEASNYILTKTYASSGNMYLDGEYLEQDENNLLHQRGFITWNNKIVPFNFLGFPFFYGPFYNFFSDDIKFVMTIIYLVLFLFILINLYKLFFKENNIKIIIISFIFLTPILFYLNFFYFNIISNILFFLFYLYYLFLFNKTHQKIHLYLSVLFASISIFFRYESIIFIFLIFLANVSLNFKQYQQINKKLKTSLIFILIPLLTFVIPLLILNYQIYGNSLTYGYSVFNKVYFPEEGVGSVFSSVKNVLFPSQIFNFPIFFNNLKTILFLISPLFFTFAYFGILKNKRYKKIGVYFLLIFYFLIYYGMNPNTYLSGSSLLTLNISVMRYWLILFPLILMPFAYYIKNQITMKKMKCLILTILIIYSLLFIIVLDSNASIIKYEERFSNYNLNKNSFGKIVNQSDYLITSVNGKIYYDQVNIIGWWGGATPSESDKFFNSTNVANISKLLMDNNHSVYYLSDRYNAKYIPLLEKEGLIFTEIPEFEGLYKITKNETQT